ncbi:MAG TPA: cytochrome C [Bacteroidetes bacterium]|nr:cytochrome C [Bacteroidota bacterium]
MKRARKILGVVALVSVIAAGGFLAFFSLKYPDAGPTPTIKVEATPARLERGSYLANHVSVCMDCHSTRDWQLVSGPIVPGTEGKGGERFDESMGFPGTIYARNITPAGIGQWTDGELYHAITTGISRDSHALFPLMPYQSYNNLSEEDLLSIITYIRSLKPVENQILSTQLNFPLNFIVKTIPEKHTPAAEPNRNNAFEYGKYLVNAASCIECHTQAVKGEKVKGMEFAGGREFPFPNGTIRTANITPDEETGIGLWTKDVFISRFKAFADSSSQRQNADSAKYYTIMPWTMFAGMTNEDLGAVYEYLRTIPPVKNQVEHFTAAPSQNPTASK